MLDNYDSFTWNLVHYLEHLGSNVIVERNDSVNYDKIDSCDKIILSPGPGLPGEAGELMEVIHKYHDQKPFLGICLGHQALAEYFNCTLSNLLEVQHGIEQQVVQSSNHYIFKDLPDSFTVGLYYSWTVKFSAESKLYPIAHGQDNLVMGFAHETLNLVGLQFHPESIMTPHGKQMLANWLGK